MFNIGLYRENMEKIFLSETIMHSASYLVYIMTYWTSTKFVQIMLLVPKMVPPQVSPGTWPTFNIYLYVSFKQNSCERLRASWPSCLG